MINNSGRLEKTKIRIEIGKDIGKMIKNSKEGELIINYCILENDFLDPQMKIPSLALILISRLIFFLISFLIIVVQPK